MARRHTATFELAGAAGRYQLSGTAAMANARMLLERGLAEFRGQPRVEIDLSGITAADGAGLAVLLAWLERARAPKIIETPVNIIGHRSLGNG